MKELETKQYKKPNGTNSTYTVYEVNGTLISRDESETIFAERYRPRIVDDLILPKKIDEKLRDIVKTKKINNMLFYSLQGGSGKDSIISVLRNNVPMNMNTINASLNRGIDGIRNTVVGFSSTSSLDGKRKVMYLTEAGGMTKVALDSLKSVIEDTSSRVSYLMSTNSLNNISEPLQTRFQIFDMNTLPEDERKPLALKAYKRLQAILELENVTYDEKDLQKFLMSTFPSYRKMVNSLDRMIVDGRFALVADDSISETNKVIGLINAGDYEELVKISMRVDVAGFANHMATMYHKGLLVKGSDAVAFIPAVNDLQISLSENRPFPNVSFLVFCLALINGNIKLNEVK